MLKTQGVGITTVGHRVAEVAVQGTTDCEGLDFVLVMRLRHHHDHEGMNWLTCFLDRREAEYLRRHLSEILES